VGGLVVVVVTWSIGNYDYNGLSLPVRIATSICSCGSGMVGFLLKIMLTALTLGFGFKGGSHAVVCDWCTAWQYTGVDFSVTGRFYGSAGIYCSIRGSGEYSLSVYP
jgi:hypothetical protein